jgi:3-oxosteroid 1-dehydrogenase
MGWDKSVDLAIVGSGGGGMVAALAAVDAGHEPLVVEKQALIGGSTGLSGGVIWMPNNPLLEPDGVADSHADGLAYLEAAVGDVGPASSAERREMFLTAGSDMITFLQRKGVQLVGCPGYSDYYPNLKGGKSAGRSVEGVPWDGRKLGAWRGKVQPSMGRAFGLAVKTNELRSVQYFNRSFRTLGIAGRVFVRTHLSRLRRQELLTNGASLIGQMLKALEDLTGGAPVWPETPAEELIVENGRVVGIRVLRNGSPFTIEARKGVLLAAGGFGHNPEMRKKYSGKQPNEARWSMANGGDTGEVLAAAMRLGAKTDLLDEAWWLPGPARTVGVASLGQARQRPGAIFVDSTGQRFCNESNSYVEVGKAMYASKAVPAWLAFDEGYVRRYAHNTSPLHRGFPPEPIERGLVRKADTIEDLANQIGVDPAGLASTIQRFNANAVQGIDPDFGRGQSAYNTCLGDPGHKPNAALGPLDRAPYYATAIYPSDVGTCGGLVADQYGRVLDDSDDPIPGLYATGNITATVTGRTYPGAGASIANTMVFGYVAARHANGATGAGW